MILYDIIRYHKPNPPPKGSLGRDHFFNFFVYLDVDVKSGVSHFKQKRFLVQVKFNKKMVRGEEDSSTSFCCFGIGSDSAVNSY
jgi:hypothetical protein